MSSVTLKYIGRRHVEFVPHDHVVLSVIKDEALRLPYFLTYYRRLGFDRFIFVDNGSADGSRELLLEQPDVALYYTTAQFGRPPGDGLPWKNMLLDRFCDGRWVLVADADEILVWPGSEQESIRTLTEKLTARGVECLFTLMLDMYSDRRFDEIGYRAGEPFIDFAPHYDRGPYFHIPVQYCPYMEVWGGVRARIWRTHAVKWHPPMIGKVPLLRWRAGQRFIAAQHAVLKSVPLAAMNGALLHFKLLDDVIARCQEAIRSGQHYKQSRENRVLLDAILNSGGKSLFDPGNSLRFDGTHQLADIRLLERNGSFKRRGS